MQGTESDLPTQQLPQNSWIPDLYTGSKIPKEIEAIRKNRQNLLKESKITELTREYQFDKYAFSRLTDNVICDHSRIYLAAFHLNAFNNYKGKSKISVEIWLRNEGLPIGAVLYQLYIVFCKERGYETERMIEQGVYRYWKYLKYWNYTCFLFSFCYCFPP